MNKQLIDVYASATAPEPMGATTITELIESIQSTEYAEQIAKLRTLKSSGQTDKYATQKKNLQAVSLSGEVKGKRANAVKENRFIHSGFLQLDFDGGPNFDWELEEINYILKADQRIVAAFISPSGDGIKAVARIPASAESHLGSFLAAEAHFASKNLIVDPSCKDPVRLCFVSHDPDAWLDLDRSAEFEPVTVPATTPALPAQPATTQAGLILSDKRAPFPHPPQNGIHTWIMEALWWCRFHGMTESDAAAKIQAFDGSLRRALQPTEAVDAARKVFAAPMQTDAEYRAEAQVNAAMACASNSTATSYDPDDVFYDQPAGKYLIRVGNTYHQQGKQAPVITGLTRWLAKNQKWESPKALRDAVVGNLRARELDGGIQWSGSIAGHKQGMTEDCDNKPILIISEPITPAPMPGECPIIMDIIDQAFADPDALAVFISWLSGRFRAVREHTHIPSPMMVLAGEVNSGKSLLAWIVSQMLGGRTANPYSAWSGGIMWNDDLVGAELLLVDDCAASTDLRARRSFGAAFKEAMYPHIVQLRKRHSSSVSVRPVWACIVCCNDTPEALQIIPPLDNDLSDKVILLHVTPIKVPTDTSTPEGKQSLQRMLRAELPALAHMLREWETPEHLRDTRSGVLAWRDSNLLDAVDAHSPSRRLESLIETAVTHRGIWHDLPREFTALEIEARLTEFNSLVRDQAKAMFTWHGACGSALAKLARTGRGIVTLGTYDSDRKVNRYYVRG